MAPKKQQKKHTESEEENEEVEEKTTRSIKQPDVMFEFDEFKPEGKKYPHLDAKEFKSLIDTIAYNARVLFTTTQKVYGGQKLGEVTKADIRSLFSTLVKNIEMIKSYHRAKKATKHGGGSAEHLKAPFFVSDNIHDLINNVNLGNGLADLMYHWIPGKEDIEAEDSIVTPNEPRTKGKNGKASVEDFITLANEKLTKVTSKKELEGLLYLHSDAYTAGKNVKDDKYKVDEAGYVDDKRVERIVDIYNAYAESFNETYEVAESDAGYRPTYTFDQARARAIVQVAQLDGVDSSDVLDREITVKSDPWKENSAPVTFKSSFINSNMTTTIFALISNANKLTDHHNSKYSHYELYDKYFNADKESKYLPGRSTGLYFGGRNYTPKGETEDDLKVKLVKLPNLKKKDKGKGESQADKVARRFANHNAAKPLTGFGWVNQVYKDDHTMREDIPPKKNKYNKTPEEIEATLPFLKKGEEDEAYGVTNFVPTSLSHVYEIPTDFLTPETEALLKDDDLLAEFQVVKKHLQSLNRAYSAYTADAKRKRTAAKKKEAEALKKQEKEVEAKAKKTEKKKGKSVTTPVKAKKTSPERSEKKASPERKKTPVKKIEPEEEEEEEENE
jgi:hypothetical protein